MRFQLAKTVFFGWEYLNFLWANVEGMLLSLILEKQRRVRNEKKRDLIGLRHVLQTGAANGRKIPNGCSYHGTLRSDEGS